MSAELLPPNLKSDEMPLNGQTPAREKNGAKKSSSAFRKGMVLKWKASGMSKAAFCRQAGLRPNTFNVWIAAYSETSVEEQSADLSFEPDTYAGVIEVNRNSEVAAELSDSSGKRKVRIYNGASPELIDALLNSFMH